MQPYCFNMYDLMEIYICTLKRGFNIKWSKGGLNDFIWETNWNTKIIIIRKWK